MVLPFTHGCPPVSDNVILYVSQQLAVTDGVGVFGGVEQGAGYVVDPTAKQVS
jgi:hypothetical protein